MTEPYLTPTADEQQRFLISFLFGGEVRPGAPACVKRAYLDLSRTAHGISSGKSPNQLKRSAHVLVESLLNAALCPKESWTSASFDSWHERASLKICSHYASGGYGRFRVGQAQKWLNMSIKYALSLAALDMLRVDNPSGLRRVAHAPIDNIVLDALRPLKPPSLGGPWSRIENYRAYLAFQRWIRKQFADSLPLDVEFHVWIEESTRQRHLSSTKRSSASR